MTESPGKRGRIRYDWWRAHHGLPSHAKWRAVARNAQVHVSVAFHIVVCLLDAASRGQPRGSIGDFKSFDCAGIVDVPVDKVDRVVEVLREIHWIEGHMIAEWDDRQPQREDLGAARRAAEHRSRIESVTERDTEDVTHRKRDKANVTHWKRDNGNVTPANAPDRDKKEEASLLGCARETPVEKSEEQNLPARSLATALPAGALAHEPLSEQEARKRPADMSRADLEALFARRATNGKEVLP